PRRPPRAPPFPYTTLFRSASSGAAQPVKGTAVILNYAGWMGKNNVKDFEALHSGAGIKQVSESSISSGAVVPAIKANTSTYDAADRKSTRLNSSHVSISYA